MRILQVHTRYRERGGEDAVVEGERDLLSRAGHVVDRVEFSNPSGSVAAATSLLTAPWNPAAAERAVAHAERFRADVVHVHNTWFALSPAVFAALSRGGLPTVFTAHNYRLVCPNALLYRDDHICEDCVGRFPWPGIVHRCYRHSALQSGAVAVTIATQRLRRTWQRHPDVVLALTEFAVPYLISAGVPPELVEVKPNVVPDPGARKEAPSSSDAVLFVGRLSPEKGVEDLVEAWRTSRRNGLRLVVAGDGPLGQWLDHAIGGDTSIERVGRLDSEGVAKVMKGARALILPSRWYEGMPMVLLEAMASGLATVVPRHGGLPEIVGDGGLLYASGSTAALRQTLESLTDDRLVDELGGVARSNYDRRFSPSVGLGELERVYRLAIERRRRRQMGP